MNYGKDWAIFAMCLRPMNAKTTTNTLVMENYRVQNKREHALAVLPCNTAYGSLSCDRITNA